MPIKNVFFCIVMFPSNILPVKMNYEAILQQFCENPPVPVQRHFPTSAWNFITGTERSQVGERALRSIIIDFLWYNLGPAPADKSEQKLLQEKRKTAFANFGKKLVEKFPNCFIWKGQIARIGRSQPWTPLLKNVSDAIRARRNQNFGKNQPDYSRFWQPVDQLDDIQQPQQDQQPQHNQQPQHDQATDPEQQEQQQENEQEQTTEQTVQLLQQQIYQLQNQLQQQQPPGGLLDLVEQEEPCTSSTRENFERVEGIAIKRKASLGLGRKRNRKYN